MGPLEHQAEQTWISHQIMKLSQAMQHRNKVVCAVKQRQSFKGIQRHNHAHLQEYQQSVVPTCLKFNKLSEVQQVVQVQKFASREVEILRRELSVS